MLKKVGVIIILLICAACSERQTAVPTAPPPAPTLSPTITEADKIQLIKTATRWGINHLLSNNDLIQSANNVYLATENLAPGWIPSFTKYPIIPVSPTEIQQIAKDKEHIIMYLSFSEIEFGDDGQAQIIISSTPVTPDGGGVELGGEAKLEFEQVNGEWVLTVLWIAVS